MVEVVNVHFHRLTLVALELKSQFCWHKISYFLLLFEIRYLFGIFSYTRFLSKAVIALEAVAKTTKLSNSVLSVNVCVCERHVFIFRKEKRVCVCERSSVVACR